MFLIELPVIAVPVERPGAAGAAAISRALPELQASDFRRLFAGAGALSGATGETKDERSGLSGGFESLLLVFAC